MQALAKPPKLSINLPDGERGLSAAQVARFDHLQRRLARKDLKPKQREVCLDELQALEASVRDTRQRLEDDRAAAETVALARGRGEDVQVERGRIRILSRGGLRQAYEDGHLIPEHGSTTSQDLYEWGKRYRDVYELAEGLATGDKMTGGFGPKAPQVRRTEASHALSAMRARLTDRQRAVLDMVCGQDERLRAVATTLRRGFPSTRNALRAGLSALVGLKIERSPALGEHLKLKTDAIVAAQKRA